MRLSFRGAKRRGISPSCAVRRGRIRERTRSGRSKYPALLPPGSACVIPRSVPTRNLAPPLRRVKPVSGTARAPGRETGCAGRPGGRWRPPPDTDIHGVLRRAVRRGEDNAVFRCGAHSEPRVWRPFRAAMAWRTTAYGKRLSGAARLSCRTRSVALLQPTPRSPYSRQMSTPSPLLPFPSVPPPHPTKKGPQGVSPTALVTVCSNKKAVSALRACPRLSLRIAS